MIPIALKESDPAESHAWLVEYLLDEQKSLSFVERFSNYHDSTDQSVQPVYHELIPSALPGSNQQFAFEVDMDICSGCKSCVAACHNLNGLDEDEVFRDVGLLYGGTIEEPVLQTITTACHHCVDPACQEGCPTMAYDKDPVTGIVKHLDDQCIGCQYCILKCPYDVPKYNKTKGIVRKCDMCSDRLLGKEAPACVQACPNHAIKIKIVNTVEVIQRAEADGFLVGAPDPAYTLPTTYFKSKKSLPENMRSMDDNEIKPQHAHWPLVIMLVISQMSVGAFVIEQFLKWVMDSSALDLVRPVHAAAALVLGLLALGASTLHLGRPLYAFRAFLGLRTSWMSREIIILGGFAQTAAMYAAVSWIYPDMVWLQSVLGVSVAVFGLLGVFCSAMIYHDTQREFWNISLTGVKFVLTMLVLGLPMALITSLTASLREDLDFTLVMRDWGLLLLSGIIAATVVKMLFEVTAFSHLNSLRRSPMQRSAALMMGPLKNVTQRRFILGTLGGIVAPAGVLLILNEDIFSSEPPMTVWALVISMLLALVAAELHERYLFFTAVVSPKMPGGVI